MTQYYEFKYSDTPSTPNTIINQINFKSGFINGGTVLINDTTTGNTTHTTLGDNTAITITYNDSSTIPDGFNFKLDLSTPQSPSTSVNYLTSIGTNAFYQCKYISELTMPSTKLAVIGNKAFAESGLKSVKLYKFATYVVGDSPNQVGLFQGCTSLSTIDFNNYTDIQEFMFYGCTGLESIEIPTTITDIRFKAFYEAEFSSLSFATRNTETLKIHGYAFSKSEIPQLNLPPQTIRVYEYAFDGCTGFTSLVLPEFSSSKCYFGSHVFANIPILYDVKIGGNIGHVSVMGIDPTPDTTVDGSTSTFMFNNCASLKQIQLPSDLTKIEASTFENCPKLNSFSFPANPSDLTIGGRAFYNCGFVYLKLDSHVKTLGVDSFGSCQQLKQVVIDVVDPVMTLNKTFTGRTQPIQIIFSSRATLISTTSTSDVQMVSGDKIYVFTDAQYIRVNTLISILTTQPSIILKQYHDRNFINHKSIYDSENDPLYVMYTLPSSGNKFNDSTFYFRSASSTASVVVITKSDDGVLINCVKMYASSADVEGKTVQKLYKQASTWYAQTTNGIDIPISDITPEYVLQNNFICEQPYDDSNYDLILNGSNLSTCDMFDLHNLTTNSKVLIHNLKRVILTSNKTNSVDDLMIRIHLGQPQFEINRMDYKTFTITSQKLGNVATVANPSLIINNLIKDRASVWSIAAPQITINTLVFEYIVFQNQKEDDTILTKIECTDNTFLVKLTTTENETVNFQLISNKNEQIIDPASAPINAAYYNSGWSSPY